MRGPEFAASNTVERALELFGGPNDEHVDMLSRRHRAFDSAFAPGATIAVGANASRSLVDALKSSGRRPLFVPLDAWSAPIPGDEVGGVVVHAISGQAPPVHTSLPVVVDAGENGVRAIGCSQVDDAALIRVHDDIAEGVRAAAGFDTLPGQRVDDAPVTGVVVRLPELADPTTFYAYAQGECTDVEWVALRQPLHPHARQDLTTADLERSSRHLAHLFHLPIGDRFSVDEIDHAVLGVVKAAEYLGWRWWQDPDLVEQYSSFLDDKYGPDHDAYRPAFDRHDPVSLTPSETTGTT
ncbi:MAG: hypothetical protein AAFY28_11675 [Actinomycetota bacterium]